MKNQTTENDLIKSFAEIGKTEVSETSTSETYNVMKKAFITYNDKYFTQADFVTKLAKSNPRINKVLHELIRDGIIERSGARGNYHYKAKKGAPSF